MVLDYRLPGSDSELQTTGYNNLVPRLQSAQTRLTGSHPQDLVAIVRCLRGHGRRYLEEAVRGRQRAVEMG